MKPRTGRPGALLLTLCCGLLLSLLSSTQAGAADAWSLTYGREYGSNTAANVPTQAEIFTTGPGGFFVSAGITNHVQSETPFIGVTNPGSHSSDPGNLNVLFQQPTNPYNFRVLDPLAPGEQSVDCWWLAPLIRRYLFEFHFRRTTSADNVTFFPYAPAYHYDKNSDFNTQTSDSTFFNSDQNSLIAAPSVWHAQVFTVPQGMNRIIEAKARVSSVSGAPLRVRFSVVRLAGPRGNRPTGEQVGPALLSREISSGRFIDVMAAWNLDDVQVTPGQGYGLRVESADRQAVNVNGTNTSYYDSGHMYSYANNSEGWVEYIDRDLVAVAAGAFRPAGAPPPTATPPPGSGPAIGANLLTNPGFEQSNGTTHTGWINNTSFGTGGRFPDPINSLDGTQWASAIWGNGGQSVQELYQTVDVVPGVEYGLSALHFSGGTDGSVNAVLGWNDGPYAGLNNSTQIDIDRWQGGAPISWTRLGGTVIPSSNKLTLVLRAVINGFGGGVNFDQCTVTVLTAPPTPSSATPSPTAVAPTQTPTPGPSDAARADFNRDGIVDYLDLLIFAEHWHETAYVGP